jgi:hypothetical protein
MGAATLPGIGRRTYQRGTVVEKADEAITRERLAELPNEDLSRGSSDHCVRRLFARAQVKVSGIRDNCQPARNPRPRRTEARAYHLARRAIGILHTRAADLTFSQQHSTPKLPIPLVFCRFTQRAAKMGTRQRPKMLAPVASSVEVISCPAHHPAKERLWGASCMNSNMAN